MTVTAAARGAYKYEGRGVLAVDPSAFFEVFFAHSMGADANAESPGGEATLVTIRGPLVHHERRWEDSYESITKRVAAACEAQPSAIVLCIDSPGGDAQGVFECAREIRTMCDAAGKYLVTYVEGKMGSAAYALGCVAKRVVMGVTSTVGSIGVLATRPDVSARNALDGLRMSFITSGERKADGHAESPTTEAEIAAMQTVVDSIAAVFFEHVADMRGLTPDAVAALQAGVFHGDAARAAGLGDETLTLRLTLASIAGWIEQERDPAMANPAGKIKAESGDDKKPDDKKPEGGEDESFDALRARLKKMAGGDDANAKAAARALAALETEEKTDEPAAAEPDEKKPEAAAAGATSTSSALEVALRAETTVHKLRAELAAERETAKRKELITSRPDLSKEMVALLQQCPLKLVEETLSKLEAAAPATSGTSATSGASAADALAALQSDTKPTPGRGGEVSQLPAEQKAEMDRRFGLRAGHDPKAGNIDASSPYKLSLGGPVNNPPEQLKPAAGATK